MNAVGVKLGNGWYSQQQQQQHEKFAYGNEFIELR